MNKTMQSLNQKVSIVYRVPEFLYSCMIWVPSPASQCGFLLGGSHTRCWGGGGEWGTHIIRLYRNSGALYILSSLYDLKNKFKHWLESKNHSSIEGEQKAQNRRNAAAKGFPVQIKATTQPQKKEPKEAKRRHIINPLQFRGWEGGW